MEIGSLAEVIGGIASIVAACVSVAALFVAFQANRHAREANATSNETLRLNDETRRDALAAVEHDGRTRIGSQLQAWWVATSTNEWGVVIVNAAQGAAVFRDLELDTSAFDVTETIKIKMLPPGRYVVAHKKMDEKSFRFSSLPQFLTEHEANRWQPLTRSGKHTITAMRFRDPLGSAWTWNQQSGLRLQP